MKYLKKLVALCLLISVLFPSNIATAATPRLNHTTLNISSVDNVTLKVLNTTKKVTWSSSNESVVKVNQKGKLTTQWFGKATITAKVGNKTLKCKVNVLNEDFWCSLTNDKYTCTVMPFSKNKARIRIYRYTAKNTYYSGDIIATLKDGYYKFRLEGDYHITGSFKNFKKNNHLYGLLVISESDLDIFLTKGFKFDEGTPNT